MKFIINFPLDLNSLAEFNSNPFYYDQIIYIHSGTQNDLVNDVKLLFGDAIVEIY